MLSSIIMLIDMLHSIFSMVYLHAHLNFFYGVFTSKIKWSQSMTIELFTIIKLIFFMSIQIHIGL